VSKFLFINPFGIGDVLFTTPVVRAIREAYPAGFLGYWCNQRVAPVLRYNPDINTAFGISRGDLKKAWSVSKFKGIAGFYGLFRQLAAGHYDTAIDFSLDQRYGLLAQLAGIKRRIGFDYKSRGRFLTDKIPLTGYAEKHVVEYYLELLQFLKVQPPSRRLYLYVGEQEQAQSKKFLEYHGIREHEPVVGIAPGAGASWGQDAVRRHWPAVRFAQIADRIIDDLRAKVVILGDASERMIADVMIYAMKHKPIDMVGKTSIPQLAALIQRLSLLVTNEGGPLHMGVALGIKTVSIFGPGDEKVYGPYPPSERHSVLKAALECRPCYDQFRLKPCDKDKECITLIDTAEVFEAVRRLL
jgi:lipopolysaccharide heptosyltransferase II